MTLKGRIPGLGNVSNSEYFREVCRAMKMLAADRRVIFVGQTVEWGGASIGRTLEDISQVQKLEFPVAENFQLGFCTGMSLNGFIPVSVFPRINFMLECISQLVQHLDALPRYSDWRPKVIIRTGIGGDKPLNPGIQHLGDYSEAFAAMLKTVEVYRLSSAEMIVPAYERALKSENSSLLVEHLEMY